MRAIANRAHLGHAQIVAVAMVSLSPRFNESDRDA
jgi:hypothetical protein